MYPSSFPVRLLSLGVVLIGPAIAFQDYRGWPIYGGGHDQIRYSKLQQITKDNVGKLQVAWTYDTGDAFKGSEMQCNPIIVDGVMYGTTPKARLIALDAATGKLKWAFDPSPGKPVTAKQRVRGVMFWGSGKDKRVYYSYKHDFFALDATTGKLVEEFGTKGRIDLRQGLRRDPEKLTITLTTPGAVYKDLLIIGSLVSEGLPSAPGDIRAYSARTGKLVWSFHTTPEPGEFGYDTWPKDAWKHLGGTNSWAGMALDEKRGLVFVPTGSASFDFYGANRAGDNLFANSLLCLRADTGKRVWHFQTVKHDVWDRDLPAPPNLVTVRRNGRNVDAVAQITKSGYVYLFERETGKPLFPIEYRNVPTQGADGEVLAETQPFPLKPEPFARQRMTADMVTNRTPEAHRAVAERFAKLRSNGQFEPPSLEGTVVFPGFDGGGEWGGAAFDPETKLLYVNSNEMPWVLRLVPKAAKNTDETARALYDRNCAGCHRKDLAGTPPEFPALNNISARRTAEQVRTVIRQGAGRMPGFGHLGENLGPLTDFLMTGRDQKLEQKEVVGDGALNLKYDIDGYNRFLDPQGYPAVTPPWGTLNAINLDTGGYAWKIPFGEYPALDMKDTGSENYGGPVVTANGLLFIGATNFDSKFRAYDKSNGKLLWETKLPASGNATPAMYEVNGRQFIVIAAGGGKSGAPSGSSYVAFALPENSR
jgi:quinoprotein glucose dehydrogenase